MKIRTILQFVALILPVSICARTVSEQEALEVATKFVTANGAVTKTSSRQLTLVWNGNDKDTKAVTDAPFYIYNVEDGGFVMVSGDTKAEPVLAYSTERNFKLDDMPENVRFWMNEMRSHIENLRAMQSVENPTILEWNGMLFAQENGTPDTILLRTALWDQVAPYNAYTPDKMPTGCVATAMAIIMHFHKWPDAGRGTLESYSYEQEDGTLRTVKGYDLGYQYQWDIMPYELDKYEIDTERTRAIARVMYDCGVMAKANYNQSGTGAIIVDVDQPMSDYMKYDNAAMGLQKLFFSNDEWKSIMKNNLLNRQPLLYGAFDANSGGGHAFVVDGIDEKGRFHVNFGWSGVNNGYYTFPYFSSFTASHHMVCNIKPDEGGKQEDMMINYQNMPGITHKVTNMAVDTFKIDEEYIMRGKVANALNVNYSGYIAICKVGRDGQVHEFVCDTTSLYAENIEGYMIANYEADIKITTEINIGDHLALYYKGDRNGDWRRMNSYMNQDLNIYLTDKYFIDEVTSVSYSKQDSVLTIATKENAQIRMYNSEGADVTGDIANQQGLITIDRKLLQPDAYSIELISSDKDKMNFEVKF
ncbi:MAG: C10 family peptidase [Bacteroidaceae bacterium]|nr:C10 family peptidase [Bacteroidaceae bacterium]